MRSRICISESFLSEAPAIVHSIHFKYHCPGKDILLKKFLPVTECDRLQSAAFALKLYVKAYFYLESYPIAYLLLDMGGVYVNFMKCIICVHFSES